MKAKESDLEKISQGNIELMVNYTDWKVTWWEREKIGEDKITDSLEKGLMLAIERLRKGEKIGDKISWIFNGCNASSILKEKFQMKYEKAYREASLIWLKEVTEKIKNDSIKVSEYNSKNWVWKKWAENAPSGLEKRFYKALNRFREKNNLVRNERIQELILKYGIDGYHERWYWNRKKDKIIFIKIIPERQGVERDIEKKVVEMHGKQIKHHSYTPEDMSEPLEDYWYILFSATEEDLEEVLKEASQIGSEIEERIKKFREKAVKIAFKK